MKKIIGKEWKNLYVNNEKNLYVNIWKICKQWESFKKPVPA